MRQMNVPALLTADPINIFYATGVRNMTVYSMMGAVRFVLVLADGPVVLWEFGGSEHLAEQATTVDEIRTAPGVTALSGPPYVEAVVAFAAEITDTCRPWLGDDAVLAVERMDHPITDALRAVDLRLTSATEVFVHARLIKLDDEVAVMREAMHRVARGVEVIRNSLDPGRTEVEVWADLHRHLIATDGDYISTRLAQAGHRTFPYFREAGSHRIENGDLFCLDTDAIGFGSYGVDFSRTFMCGDKSPTSAQRSLHALALDQLQHNAAGLCAGVSFEEFASRAWIVPDRFAPYGYYCLAHGLGLSGEFPYVPTNDAAVAYGLDGGFEAGMVICVESYIGDPDTHQGVKLEDQYLITPSGVERMSTTPFDAQLLAT
jgi:Xaa-Pro dipeptidase